MAAERKSFDNADEVRSFPKGRLELIKIGGASVARATLEPGWRWLTSVQPLAKTLLRGPALSVPHGWHTASPNG